MTDFNQAAAGWDEDPVKSKLAREVGAAMSRELVLSQQMDVFEFGCGTGLVTLQLLPHVRHMVGADSSAAMLRVLERKTAASGIANLRTLLLASDETLCGSYHLVVSSMVLHHVADVPGLLRQFLRILTPGGILALADLDQEDGSFHPEPDGVFHFGFDREELRRQIEAAGFSGTRFSPAAEVLREHHPGTKRRYPVFLMTAVKPA